MQYRDSSFYIKHLDFCKIEIIFAVNKKKVIKLTIDKHTKIVITYNIFFKNLINNYE